MTCRPWIAAVAVVLVLAGCATPVRPPAAETPAPTASNDPLAGLTVEQRVGQLFIVGTTASAAEEAASNPPRATAAARTGVDRQARVNEGWSVARWAASA